MFENLSDLISMFFLSHRLSSLRHEFMRRPSTSSCMSPMMVGVLTTLYWRQQGEQQDDLVIWMRMMSVNELSEFVGFISNDLMTEHTITSDLLFFLPISLYSLTLDSVRTTLVPYNTQMPLFLPHILPASPRK